MLKLTNLLFDPLVTELSRGAGITIGQSHLLSLSLINSSREAWYWARQIAKEAFYERYRPRNKGDMALPREMWSISKVLMISFLLARRSLPGKMGSGFSMGLSLAQEQNISKSEEPAEESDW